MKISIVSTIYGENSGAIGIITKNQVDDLSNLGHSMSVFTVGDKAGWDQSSSIPTYHIEYKEKPWIFRQYLCIKNKTVEKEFNLFLKTVKPDVVHFHGLYYHIPYSVIKIAKKSGAKVIITVHDVMAVSPQKLHHFIKKDSKSIKITDYKISSLELLKQNGKSFNPLRNLFIRHYLKFADSICCVSKALIHVMTQNQIENTKLLYNGIKPEEWSASNEEVSEFKHKYSLDNKKVLLVSGRLSGAKGINETLKMLSVISKEIDNVLLFMACNKDGYSNKIMQLAKLFGVEGKVLLSGWLNRNEMRIAYASSTLVLVPSVVFDSFPTVNLEAMASSKAVIGTCFGGTPEIVQDGISGFIINPYMTSDFSEKVIYLLQNQNESENMGRNGNKIVSEKFTQKKHIENLLKIYRD